MSEAKLGGGFMFPSTSIDHVQRVGYGAMQLTGPGVYGPPKDPDGAVAVLREAVASGVSRPRSTPATTTCPHATNEIHQTGPAPVPLRNW